MIHLTPWKVMNSVFHFNLNSTFKFHKIVCNKFISYEPELFPAALISKWSPVHVTLFTNGKGIITGVRLHSEAVDILKELNAYLNENDNILRQ